MSYEPADDAWVTIFLEEYKALRAEIIDAIQAHRTMLQLGITGESVLIGVGLPQVPSAVATVLLAVLVPAVTMFVVAAAWGDLYRSARASHYLLERERELAMHVAAPIAPLEWERWLRRGKIFTGQTDGQFAVLYVLTLASALLGCWTMFQEQFRMPALAAVVFPFRVVVLILAGVGIVGALALYLQRRQRTATVFDKGLK